MKTQSTEIHSRFIDIASALDTDLADCISQTGPVEFQPDSSMPLANRLCRSVAGQQLSVKAARSIWNRIVKTAGDQPLIDFFHEKNIDLMRSCGLSAAKVRSMCGITEKARHGGLEAADLRNLSHKVRSKKLTQLWGVGQWTADMISIFYFGDEDVWPDGDLAARKNLKQLTSPRRKTVRTAERFAPHRSWLALYMWKYQDVTPDK